MTRHTMTVPYWSDDLVTLYHANALALPLEDATVDLVVTSPPYFGLRSYQDAGEHYAGQIGSEATPAEFVDALIAATREMVRVLKPSGSIWVNLGDKYAGNTGGDGVAATSALTGKGARIGSSRRITPGRPKSLIGIPARYMIRCIDDLGLILRAEVIWSKPNGLPESVTDRVRRSHETWFHFTKEPRYYSAVDEIREAHAPTSLARYAAGFGQTKSSAELDKRYKAEVIEPNPLGKLPGSVWTIATQPLTVPTSLGIDHFAAFPMEWPRRIITGWSPREVCTVCGEGRRPVATADREHVDYGVSELRAVERVSATNGAVSGGVKRSTLGNTVSRTVTGYACACPNTTAPTTPGVVLDPFSGTGTTALMAKVLGRRGIGVDLSADYCRLARWRVNDPGQIASAMQVEKPETPMDDQGVLDFGASA